MKNHFFLFALLLSLIMVSCSNNEQEVLPLSPQLEKPSPNPFPYPAYQTFPEVKVSKFDYSYSAKGLSLTINPQLDRAIYQLFAVIEFEPISDPGIPNYEVSMVFLGNPNARKYFIPGLVRKNIKSLKVYGYTGRTNTPSYPYPNSYIFKNHGIKGWSAGDNIVKVSSETFQAGLKHLFVQMTSEERSILMFLGKPQFEDFEFPKETELKLNNVRLFNYSISTRDI